MGCQARHASKRDGSFRIKKSHVTTHTIPRTVPHFYSLVTIHQTPQTDAPAAW